MRPAGSAGNLNPDMIRQVETSPLSVRAELGALDSDARTVDLVISTGAPVDRYDYKRGEYFVETLSLDPAHVRMDRLNAGASVLDSHAGYSLRNVIGAIVPGSAKIERGKRLIGRALMSAREEVAPILRDIRDKIIRFASVGYSVYAYRDTGKTDARGWRILEAIDWEPAEVSFVPIPADFLSQTRAADGAARVTATVIAESGDPVHVERSTMEPIQNAPAAVPAPAAPAAEPAPAAPAPAVRAAAPAPALAAVTVATIDQVRQIGTAAKMAPADILDLAARAARENLDVHRVREIVIDNLAARAAETAPAPGAAGVSFGVDAADRFARGVMTALVHRADPTVRQSIAAAAKRDEFAGHFAGLDGDPAEFRGMTLLDLARRSLEFAGVKTSGLSKMEIAGRAFTMRRDLGGAMTPSDFPNLLENVLNKVMLAGYATQPDTWRRFCKRGTVSDFRASGRYRMGTFGTLPALNGTEFQTITISDAEKASIQAATKGGIVTISRALIINDDLGGLTDLMTALGRAAGLTVEVDAYALLTASGGLGANLNGTTLFHASRNNIGTGAAISAAALDADAALMAKQTAPGGAEYVGFEASILIVPRDLRGSAIVINGSEFDPDNVASGSKATNRPNVIRGQFSDIIGTPRLTGTRRYLLADPGIAPVLEVAFLDGQDSPVLETRDGWRQDGAEMRARFDYGTAVIDYRGAVTNAGA